MLKTFRKVIWEGVRSKLSFPVQLPAIRDMNELKRTGQLSKGQEIVSDHKEASLQTEWDKE